MAKDFRLDLKKARAQNPKNWAIFAAGELNGDKLNFRKQSGARDNAEDVKE